MATTHTLQRPSSNWKSLKATIVKESGTTCKRILKERCAKKRKIEEHSDATLEKFSITTNEHSSKLISDKTKPSKFWFDDVSKADIEQAYGIPKKKIRMHKTVEIDTHRKEKLGKYVAMDCEMVGVGPDGVESALARVSVVNYHGAVLLDRYVRPQEKVIDFRTSVSGILPAHIRDAPPFAEVQAQVADLLKSRIVVGHALENDFRALLLEHPKRDIRDTARYAPLRQFSKGKTPSLKRLAKEMLGLNIQEGQHDSVEDARVAMLLFHKVKNEWDARTMPRKQKIVKTKTSMI